MPYINAAGRMHIDPAIDALTSTIPIDALPEGDLNYLLTNIVKAWLGSKLNYARYNAAVGVLECVKLEFYRRVVTPYETVKMHDNGDVY